MAASGAGPDFLLYQRGENDESDTWDDSVLIKAYDDAVSAMKVKITEQNPEFTAKVENKPKKKKKAKSKQKKKKIQSSATNWRDGDSCQARYTEDGEIYDAKIVSIDEEDGTCIVQYKDYGNEEEQELINLLPQVATLSSQEQVTDTASECESLPRNTVVRESTSAKHRDKVNSSANKNSQKRQKHNPQPFPWSNNPNPLPFGAMPPPPTPPHPNFPPFQVPGYQASGPSMPVPPMFPSIPPPPPPFADNGSGDDNEALYSMLISWYMSGYHTGYYQGLKHGSSSHGAQR